MVFYDVLPFHETSYHIAQCSTPYHINYILLYYVILYYIMLDSITLHHCISFVSFIVYFISYYFILFLIIYHIFYIYLISICFIIVYWLVLSYFTLYFCIFHCIFGIYIISFYIIKLYHILLFYMMSNLIISYCNLLYSIVSYHIRVCFIWFIINVKFYCIMFLIYFFTLCFFRLDHVSKKFCNYLVAMCPQSLPSVWNKLCFAMMAGSRVCTGGSWIRGHPRHTQVTYTNK